MQTDQQSLEKHTSQKHRFWERPISSPSHIYIYYYDGDLMDIVYFLIISKKNRKIIFLTAIIDYWWVELYIALNSVIP